jgi:SAM-dependent methyltransferase
VRATITERYDYYDGAFDDLRDYLIEAGVEIWDLDMTEPVELPEPRAFDLITNMALLEHLAHSPRPVMENMAAALAPGGRILLEVPNLAYWPKRMDLLAGRTVHPPLRDVYLARTPFTGHHREYTRHDLEELCELSGFAVERVVTFNYTQPEVPPRGPLWLMDLPRRFIPGAREVLLACVSNARGN